MHAKPNQLLPGESLAAGRVPDFSESAVHIRLPSRRGLDPVSVDGLRKSVAV